MNRSAESIIRKHYGLTRRVTEAEVEAEIVSLIRKHTRGSLDDMSEPLWAALVVAGHILED